jgi:hypothetical protein
VGPWVLWAVLVAAHDGVVNSDVVERKGVVTMVQFMYVRPTGRSLLATHMGDYSRAYKCRGRSLLATHMGDYSRAYVYRGRFL